MARQKIIGITMGDAAGVGPEVIAKALANYERTDDWLPLLIGDADVMIKAMALVGNRCKLVAAGEDLLLDQSTDVMNILDLKNLLPSEVEIGKVSAACGKASVEYIIKAAQLALHHKIDALVTAPINKESTTLAGFGELGHLELLAHFTDTKEYATMLVSDNLRVVHLTTHYSVKEAIGKVKKELILARLKLTQKCFSDWGYPHPIIAVAALNPHAGEHGIMGNEEAEEIIPAVNSAREMRIDARGPFPADTIFVRAIKGEFDVVIALYHDQGHIPVKVHNSQNSVSIALGLPFIRTSVDHGTAFDIAWKGIADSTSMRESIMQAVKLAGLKELGVNRQG